LLYIFLMCCKIIRLADDLIAAIPTELLEYPPFESPSSSSSSSSSSYSSSEEDNNAPSPSFFNPITMTTINTATLSEYIASDDTSAHNLTCASCLESHKCNDACPADKAKTDNVPTPTNPTTINHSNTSTSTSNIIHNNNNNDISNSDSEQGKINTGSTLSNSHNFLNALLYPPTTITNTNITDFQIGPITSNMQNVNITNNHTQDTNNSQQSSITFEVDFTNTNISNDDVIEKILNTDYFNIPEMEFMLQ
jgi:hypothetical protein